MAVALLSSVLIHTLLLSLTFGDQGLGLPGLGLPWRERRVEVPDLRVVLLPARVTPAAPPAPAAPVVKPKPVAQPSQQVSIKPPAAVAPAPVPRKSPAPAQTAKAPAIDAKPLDPPALVVPPPPPAPAPAPVPTTVIAVAPSASSPETVLPSLRDAEREAQRLAQRNRLADLDAELTELRANRNSLKADAANLAETLEVSRRSWNDSIRPQSASPAGSLYSRITRATPSPWPAT